MSLGLLGKKIGMTRVFDKDAGVMIPVNVIDVSGNEYLQVKTTETDGYSACLLYTSPSPRDKRQSRMPSSA